MSTEHNDWCDGHGSSAGSACCRAVTEPTPDTPESELTGDGLRALAERAARRLATKAADDHAWGPRGPGGNGKHGSGRWQDCGDPFCSDARAILAALPNREAAPREGLDAAGFRCGSCQTPGHYAGDRTHPCIPLGR